MNYTVAEAERILAEAKAREAGGAEPDALALEEAELWLQKHDPRDGYRILAAWIPKALARYMMLTRPLAPAQPVPAPSEEDDLRLARECAAEAMLERGWNAEHLPITREAVVDGATRAIRAERTRAGGVKAEPEWIEWHGGECPVPAETRVEVRFRSGYTPVAMRAGWWAEGESDWWKHEGRPASNIIAYRILGEQP